MRVRIKKAPTYQNGGELPVTQGLPQGQQQNANVEAEGGEVYQDNTGAINKISDNAPDHENGGVKLDDVNRVLEDTSTKRKDADSRALAITPENAELITGFKPKGNRSHAKLLEESNDFHTKQVKKLEAAIQKSLKVLDDSPADIYANNSLNLNFSNLQNIPTKGELMDNLFTHQEGVKAGARIGDAPKKAKYGIQMPKGMKKAQNGLQDYQGATTPEGRYTPTGIDVNNQQGYVPLDQYKSQWKAVGLNLDDAKDAREAQDKTYDFILKKNPDALRTIWGIYGNTRQGLTNNILTDKYPNGNFGEGGKDLTIDDLKKLKSAYVDNQLGPRRLVPGSEEETTPPTTVQGSVPGAPAPAQAPPAAIPPPPRNYSVTGSPKGSPFNEPLQWYDVAGPLGAYLSAINRKPVEYNPMDFHQLQLQLQNPLPALESGQTDFNAALANLQTQGNPGGGVASSNAATLFGKKYQLDNQILGQYENINKGIKNQEIEYNTHVRDQQSAADQGARETFTNKIALGEEAQRLQKLRALDDLYTRIAQNRRFNKEGNLLMKLAPSFDQNADYNGSKYIFRTPLGIAAQPTASSNTVTTKPGKTTKKNFVIIGGQKYAI